MFTRSPTPYCVCVHFLAPQWLQDLNVCDYSLLVGLHFSDARVPPDPSGADVSMWKEQYGGVLAGTSVGMGDSPLYKPGHDTAGSGSISGAEPAPEECTIYMVGLIDILTQYDLKKKAEHRFKSFAHDSVSSTGHGLFRFRAPTSASPAWLLALTGCTPSASCFSRRAQTQISAQAPTPYRTRFMKYVASIVI